MNNDSLRSKLLNADYKEFKPNRGISLADAMFQKKFWSKENNKIIFLNFYQYKARKNPQMKETWKADAVFYQKAESSPWITLERHCVESESLKKIEEFFILFYKKMNCIPDIYNND